MILFFKNLKARSCKLNKGMTYIEVITILAIFTIMTSIILFNYKEFQARVDIKNLASDIALKIVEAQKESLDGKLPPSAQQILISPPPLTTFTWKPSYGVYFKISTSTLQKQFLYFTDVKNQDTKYNDSTDCLINTECLDKITITKNNYISNVSNCDSSSNCTDILSKILNIAFRRPDYNAIFSDGTSSITPDSHIQIEITSGYSSSIKSRINVYPSGRIQIN